MRNFSANAISFRSRIMLSFAALTLVLLVKATINYIVLTHIEGETKSLQTDSISGLFVSTQLMDLLNESYRLNADFVLARDAATRSHVEQQIQDNLRAIESTENSYKSTIFRGEDRQNFQNFTYLLHKYLSGQQQILDAGQTGTFSELVELAKTKTITQFKEACTALRVVIKDNRSLADVSIQSISANITHIEHLILGFSAFGIVVAILIALGLHATAAKPLRTLVSAMNDLRQGDFTKQINMKRGDEFGAVADGFDRMVEEIRSLVGQVQKSSIQVSTSMTTIAATSKQQQATASEIAATTTEVGATSKEISATAKELSRTMKEVSKVAEATGMLAGNGQTSLSRMEDTMRHVTEAAGSINGKLTVLNEKAGNINQVVTTISKVADQTNLLSLNAAIEAEKAGEYGRGFAVVATEIRRLADQTGVATYDIEQIVKEIQGAISAGVMGMDKFSEEVRRGMHDVQQVGEQLSQIIQEVQALVPRFEMVNDGMKAQATGAEQINDSLLQLTEAAQQTVESLRQSTSTIDDLNNVSGLLRSSVTRFKVQA